MRSVGEPSWPALRRHGAHRHRLPREPAEPLLEQLRHWLREHPSVSGRTLCGPTRSRRSPGRRQRRADLIVLGARADGGSRRLSSVPQGVMDRVECAVLVV